MRLSDGFEIAELAEIRQVDVVVQQMVVNNEAKNVMGKAYAICCPHCGRAIYQFPPDASEADALKARREYSEELENIAKYCPSCGTRLKYIAAPSTSGPSDDEVEAEK